MSKQKIEDIFEYLRVKARHRAKVKEGEASHVLSLMLGHLDTLEALFELENKDAR